MLRPTLPFRAPLKRPRLKPNSTRSQNALQYLKGISGRSFSKTSRPDDVPRVALTRATGVLQILCLEHPDDLRWLEQQVRQMLTDLERRCGLRPTVLINTADIFRHLAKEMPEAFLNIERLARRLLEEHLADLAASQ